jgi:hypothetical protein
MNNKCECESCKSFKKIGFEDQNEFVNKFLTKVRDVISESVIEQKDHIDSCNLSDEDFKKASIACLITNVQMLTFIACTLEITSGGNIQELFEIVATEYGRAINSLNKTQPVNINHIVHSNMVN